MTDEFEGGRIVVDDASGTMGSVMVGLLGFTPSEPVAANADARAAACMFCTAWRAAVDRRSTSWALIFTGAVTALVPELVDAVDLELPDDEVPGRRRSPPLATAKAHAINTMARNGPKKNFRCSSVDIDDFGYPKRYAGGREIKAPPHPHPIVTLDLDLASAKECPSANRTLTL